MAAGIGPFEPTSTPQFPVKSSLHSSEIPNVYSRTRVSFSSAEWLACKRDITDADLVGAGPCYGGLDLGSVSDLTSFALFFPLTGYCKVWSWCPSEHLARREETDRVPYRQWAEADTSKPRRAKQPTKHE